MSAHSMGENSVTRKNTLAVAVLVGIALAALLCPTAMADPILFTTFGPGNSYDTGHHYGVEGTIFQAFQFVPVTSGALGSITVALARTGTGFTTEFDLYTGTATALGSLLETFIVPNTTSGSIVTFNSIIMPTLTTGQIYWLSFSEPPSAPDGSGSAWFFNDQGIFGTRLTSLLPAHSATLPAFSVQAAVPEPTSVLLFATGLAAIGLTRWLMRTKVVR